ncbi:MAG TPA: hypothetical protein PK325_02625 [Cyclobacteriaceae bacterium]|nr:hypothetical protein [Cyclobacteriaceae bacterium]HMV07593.1 hypothetical protein [Cyclobacteriaceae bacterium]HMW98728.1 hypothetical protein [Cyclobacteriaceae bacterium]HMX48638.1 hypothetical protein [Cyclobacteriaceae bacterium]HMY95443.1 hypothetical protein [Cyclobacteriaceae bacterium]
MTPVNPYLQLLRKALLCLGFVIVLIGFNAFDASAQNTKGDRPEVRSGAKRENRFKIQRRKNQSKPKYNRLRPRRFSPASSARLSQPTKSNRNFYSRNVYSNNKSVSAKLSRQNTRSGGRISLGSASGRTRNFFSQRNRFVNNRSTSQRSQRYRIYSNRSQVARAKRFGTKQNPPRVKGTAAPRTVSRPFISRKSTTPFAGFWNQKPKGEKPYTKGDLAGRPLRTKNFETRKPVIVNPTANPYRVRPSRSDRPYSGPIRGGYVSATKSGQPWKGDIAGRKIKGRNYSTKRPAPGGKRIFPPPTSISGRNRGRSASLPGGGYRSVSGKISNGGSANPVRSLGRGSWNNKGRAISGRNAGANGNLGFYSGNIKSRRGYNPQGETYTGNLKARKRIKGGGSISGAWNNNGRAVAGKNAGANGNLGFYSGNVRPRRGYSPQGETYTGNIKARKRVTGGGSISGAWNNNGRAIAGKHAGANGNLGFYSGNVRPRRGYSPQGETYTGNIKARKREKGGGSITGSWNNNGRAIAGRNAGGDPTVSRYQGNVKFQRRAKGGGSISGSWNNNGRAIAGRNTGGDPTVSRYQGNVKFQRKAKGGGSISGSWNNNGRAIAGRNAGGDPTVSRYQGNVKYQRKEKGGGSISGSWNNNGRAIAGRYPGGDKNVSYYQGNLKFKPKEKGGGSVSGKHWNNNEQPTTVKDNRSTGMASFQGNIKAKKKDKPDVDYFPQKKRQFDFQPSMRDQGEEYTGNIKLARFKRNFIKNPNQADEALKKNRPDKTTYLVNGLQVKVKEKDYKKRPHAADGSMPGIAPGKNSIRASEYSRVIRRNWDYKRNPSSARAALRVREPGKAFLDATKYQGNIKMKRFDFFRKKDLYPDSRFVKTNKNNTDEERSLLTNFRLWWARLFKKNENQPDHLKEKVKKPRYDKGEQGLWYD